METSFAGKRVLVTGTARGIGRRIAERFVEAGAAVTGFDLRPGGDAPFRTIRVDVGDPRQVEAASVGLAAEAEGLDILVNAAGLLRTGAVEELTAEEWRACMDVNAGGVFHLLRHWVPVFKRQRHGAIVTVSSNAAHVPRTGMAAYCASKAAVSALTRVAGLELAGYGIRCNLVSPGSTDTPMLAEMLGDSAGQERLVAGLPEAFKLGIPLRKIATPDDIADAVLYLASDRAGHVTMQDIVVDGGATLGA